MPTYVNNQWQDSAPSGLGYTDPWQVWHQGVVDPQTGKVFFPNISNERIGTADVSYGFANQAGTPFAGVTSGVNDPNKTTQSNLDWIKNNITQGTNYGGQSGFEVNQNALPDLSFQGNLVQTARDNGKYAVKDKGLLGGLGGLGSILGLAAMFVPGLQPFAAGLNIFNGIESGNIGQALGGIMGLPGVSTGLTSMIGSGLSDLGVSSSILPYATKGVIGTGGALLSGANPMQALTSGLAQGAGLYAGQQVGQMFGGVNPNVVNALSQASAKGLSAGIMGQNPLYAALSGGINGLTGTGLGNQVGSYLNQQNQQQQMQQKQSQLQQQLMARIQASRQQQTQGVNHQLM